MWEILLISVYFTSLLSGVFGMGGGMILLGIYGWLLPITSALILHGATQIASNGFRSYLNRKSIQWKMLLPYLVGAFLCASVFWWVSYTPVKSWVFIGLGIIPFVSLVLPESDRLDPSKTWVLVSCGFVVTSCQLLVGVSGPLLDVFFIRSKLTRYELVATKAITQTAGHVLKLTYYSNLVMQLKGEWPLPLWIFPAVIGITFLGVVTGKKILGKLNELQFRSMSKTLTLMIGAVFLVRGFFYIV